MPELKEVLSIERERKSCRGRGQTKRRRFRGAARNTGQRAAAAAPCQAAESALIVT